VELLKFIESVNLHHLWLNVSPDVEPMAGDELV